MIKTLASKMLLPAFIFVLLSTSGCSDQDYNTEYKRTENHNGVVFYYFKSDDSPRLEPENNFNDLEQLKYILSLIQDLPPYSLNSFEKSGRDSFTNKLANGSKITAWIKKCHKKTNPYYCAEKIIYSPNPKDMAVAKANKYPNKYLFVSADQYGNEWPYLFEFGLLECKRYRDVVIIANHKVYAVNGKAMGAKMPTGTKTYEDAWNVRKSIYGTGRMPPPNGLIQKGLGLCR